MTPETNHWSAYDAPHKNQNIWCAPHENDTSLCDPLKIRDGFLDDGFLDLPTDSYQRELTAWLLDQCESGNLMILRRPLTSPAGDPA